MSVLDALGRRLAQDDFKKLGLVFLASAVAVPAAGLYGMLHNQISYTVSPEYFTRFKFEQFGLTGLALPDRAKASVVGLMASWWMGVPIGALVGAAGLVHEKPRRMAEVTAKALGVVLAFTLCFGLLGLLYGLCRTARIRPEDYNGWYVPNHVRHLRRFLCAGYMHDSSYLGGGVSVLAAWAFQARAWLADRRRVIHIASPAEQT